ILLHLLRTRWPHGKRAGGKEIKWPLAGLVAFSGFGRLIGFSRFDGFDPLPSDDRGIRRAVVETKNFLILLHLSGAR
nr:hypothetical protein [Gammaproteobacteria bacterium]